jgi:hypothetical protein
MQYCSSFCSVIGVGSLSDGAGVLYMLVLPTVSDAGAVQPLLTPLHQVCGGRAHIGLGILPDQRCYLVLLEDCEPRTVFREFDSSGGDIDDLTIYLLRPGCHEAITSDDAAQRRLCITTRRPPASRIGTTCRLCRESDHSRRLDGLCLISRGTGLVQAPRACYTLCSLQRHFAASDIAARPLGHRRPGRWSLPVDRFSGRSRPATLAGAAAQSHRLWRLALPVFVGLCRQSP